MPGVDAVTGQRRLLDQIFAVLNTAAGVAALMLVALPISTTIRLSAFFRRRELGIMRLDGAPSRFIRTPFILEGVLASLIGSVLAAAAIVQLCIQGYLQRAQAASALSPCRTRSSSSRYSSFSGSCLQQCQPTSPAAATSRSETALGP